MYKMFLSMLLLSTISVTAMDKLPSAMPAPILVKEQEQERKIKKAIRDSLLKEKYDRCVQIFDEESKELRESLQDSDAINAVISLPQ